MDWSKYYPQKFEGESPEVEFLDVGCGYGGLLITLSKMFPNTLILGMEIRVKVSDYVMDRIKALQVQHPGCYTNIACLRTNAMKYLPNYFKKGQLKKMFFLYPDPHFKKSKHKWRIINKNLLAEYAYVLKEGAIVYTITDVQDLHEWMVQHFKEHPLFERVSESETVSHFTIYIIKLFNGNLQNADPITEKLYDSSEEGQKVTRNSGSKFLAIFRRVPDPYLKNV